VVLPVLLGLGLDKPCSQPSRIWWCPTGDLSFLPLHAAGNYQTSTPGSSGDSVSDFVVSSYTPTLTALVSASGRISTRQPVDKLLAVAQANAPGAGPLPKTTDELRMVEKRCAAKNVPVVIRDGTNATIERVLEDMSQCNFVHFACHGIQDPGDPTKSGLLLANGRLQLDQLIQRSFPTTELVFLSACQTATGDDKLAEEAIHLAAGMLLTGIKGVVATMWSIMDKDGPFVADKFYAALLAGGRPDTTTAAYGLHDAVQDLRARGAHLTEWVPFIHIGV